MQKAEGTKYLRNYLSKKVGVQESIKYRRKKGWSKVFQIISILGEVNMGAHHRRTTSQRGNTEK